MQFKARIFVQGVGVYVAHDDPPKLEVLFPDSGQPHLAPADRLTDGKGNPFGQHWAVVQYSTRNEKPPTAKDQWRTTPLTGCLLRIESDSKQPLTFADDDHLGLPVLDDYLEEIDLADVSALRQDLEPTATIAKLEVDAGMVGPDLEHLGTWEWTDRRGRQPQRKHKEYSSVMRIELGLVSSLFLVIKPFGEPQATRVELGPAAGVCDVWVRHDCDPKLSKGCEFADRPGPRPELIHAGDQDVDFTLNYALSTDPRRIQHVGLPSLTVHRSWEGGSPIGGRPQQCMGGLKAKKKTKPQ